MAALLTLLIVAAVLRFGVAAVPFGASLAASAGTLLAWPEAFETPEPEQDAGALILTHGVASGDVTPTSAVVWTRTSHAAEVLVAYEVEQEPAPDLPSTSTAVHVTSEQDDFAVAVQLTGLLPDTPYVYRVFGRRDLADGSIATIVPTRQTIGRFRTAPEAHVARPVAFVFGGDLGGGGYCRQLDSGYTIFGAMGGVEASFFLALGDMMYADNTCARANPSGESQVVGPPRVTARTLNWEAFEAAREGYYAHWRYNRADPALQRLLRDRPMYTTWDDHEIVNNSGASWEYWSASSRERAGFPTLASAARAAFFAWAPLARELAEPNRIYRSYRWGADLELFILDTRSYRSRNDAADAPDNPKTMLGAEQLGWLKRELVESTATWKVVASSVALSVPTGGALAPINGRDGWANGTSWDYASQTGFERELLDLVSWLDARAVRNVVFVSADIHQPQTIRYEIDLNGDGRPIAFHEITAGPLSATPGRFVTGLDPTLNPTLLYREGGFFNFGYVRVERAADGVARFASEIRDATGAVRSGSRIELVPAS